MEDEALYARAQAGDVEAFDRLYERYERKPFGFLLRHTSNRAIAEELFHDVFVKVLAPEGVKFTPGGFAPWLFRIARNHLANRHRSAHRGARSLAQLDEPLPSANPEELVVQWERAAGLARAVEALPSPLASIFHLRTSGLSYEEIADVLDIPVGTVKSRINSMVQHLRGVVS